jgi:hypothetical protein
VRPSSRLFPLRPGIGSVPAHLSVTSAPRCRAHHRHLCVPAFKLCVLHCRCRYRRQALTTMQTNLGHAFTLYPPFASTLELWKKTSVPRSPLQPWQRYEFNVAVHSHVCVPSRRTVVLPCRCLEPAKGRAFHVPSARLRHAEHHTTQRTCLRAHSSTTAPPRCCLSCP